MPFIILFVIIPLLELAIFGAVSEHIGLITALFLALLTAMIGGNVVRMQGLMTIASMRTSMDRGKIPTAELFDGFCLVAAGALLITPGFLTDAIGFALLVPAFRSALRTIIKQHTDWVVETNYSGTGNGGSFYRHSTDSDIIEGEYENIDPDTLKDDHKHLS